MATADGISTEEWDVISELAVQMARLLSEREMCASRMVAELDKLERKYGRLPSIVATRADMTDDLDRKEQLLHEAYALAQSRADELNQLYVAHSLAQLYVEECPDRVKAQRWVSLLKEHLGRRDDEVLAEDYRAFSKALSELGSS